MPKLSISLLGSPQVLLNSLPIKLPTSRAFPLLGYLAINRYPQTRETLANLLWTDSPQHQALAALRTTLWRLKHAGLEDWITWDRSEISLTNPENMDIDVVNFQERLARCELHGHPLSNICLYCTPALTEAVALYRGEFMKGFNISRAPAFDDWRMQQSETFETTYLDALERLVKCHRTFGDFNLAIHYARVWINADRLNENPHLQLLQLYSITGQRTYATSLFKRYKSALYRELGLQPSEEITLLHKQIVSGRSTSISIPKTKTPVILIAEIENASLYWARVEDKKEHILNNYLNIIRDTARRYGGNILQRAEDNFTILFENGQALHYAVSIFLKLKKTDWGTSNTPSIRMVLFSTALDYDNAPNFTSITHAASSLLSISWGGQIVFTDQTLRNLDLPSGATVSDLGFHFLNNSEGSVHVFELRHPSLPSTEHPPLLSRNRQLVNTPNFEPNFIGREKELAELKQLVLNPSNRMTTLIGPGGVGKTRLAVEFATGAVDHFPDGIFFISLASIQDAKFIPILVADTLKFNFYGPASYDDQLGEYLHREKILLIVDNFEHLRVEGAKFLAALLSNTHFLKVLVTSRERLNLIAESVMELKGFPVPDLLSTKDAASFSSVRLFVQNAQKTLPKFSDQNNIEAIIRICQIVDGIPLAILLASSWVRVFSCSEIASEITKNVDFLSSSAHDLDPRHHSLIAVFDSSWKLLSEEERMVIRRLSIFQSSFSNNAAQDICNASPLILSILTDKSLLYRRQDGTYQMLTTFNQYAVTKLAEVEAELISTRDKFCEYYAEFCAHKQAELNSRNQRNAIIAISAEIENIRIAWNWMIDSNRWDLLLKTKDPLLTYYAILGNFYQGEEFFNSALAKLNKLNLPELELIRAYMLQHSVWMKFKRGFSSDVMQTMNDCLEIFRRHNASFYIAMSLYYLAEIHRVDGRLFIAKELILQAIAQLQASPNLQSNYLTGMLAHFQTTLGRILLGEGDYSQARQILSTSLQTHVKIGTLYGIIYPLVGLARLAFLEGDFIKARDLYHQALDEAININDHRSLMLLHNNLSDVYEAIANVPESRHHLLTALKLCKETGDRRLTAVIMNNLAYQQLKYDHQPAESIRTYHETLALFLEIGDLRGIAYSSYDISKAYLQVGLLEEAWNYCLNSLNTARTLDSTPILLHALHGFAYYYGSVGQYRRAIDLCTQIISHPEVETDTRRRAIVSKAILEASLSPDTFRTDSPSFERFDLQEIVNQVLAEKPQLVKNPRPTPLY